MNYVDLNISQDFENIQEVSALMLENWFEPKTELAEAGTFYACGIANKYSDPSKIPEEKNAWAEAAVRKHALN